MRRFTTLLAVIMITTAYSQTMAQTLSRLSSDRVTRSQKIIPAPPSPTPYPWWNTIDPWWHHRHPYNPVEGILNGRANLLRAQGDRAKKMAEARIRSKEAERLEMENKVIRVQRHLEREQMGRQTRDARHAERRTSVQRYLATKRQSQQEASTQRILHPSTGKIEWPETLMDDQYTPTREELERLFDERTQSTNTAELSRQIEVTANAMTNHLKSNIRQLPTNDYMNARRFMTILEREARL